MSFDVSHIFFSQVRRFALREVGKGYDSSKSRTETAHAFSCDCTFTAPNFDLLLDPVSQRLYVVCESPFVLIAPRSQSSISL